VTIIRALLAAGQPAAALEWIDRVEALARSEQRQRGEVELGA
jgi:hypothetical protein